MPTLQERIEEYETRKGLKEERREERRKETREAHATERQRKKEKDELKAQKGANTREVSIVEPEI